MAIMTMVLLAWPGSALLGLALLGLALLGLALLGLALLGLALFGLAFLVFFAPPQGRKKFTPVYPGR